MSTDIEVITIHLSRDHVMKKLIGKYGLPTITPGTDYFASLAESVISQQLSERAGRTIWEKLKGLFPGSQVTPEAVAAAEISLLRTSGISNSKALYLKNIATAFLEKTLDPEAFAELENEAIMAELMKIKGIGPWTAEMFLIFTLGRADVFSPGDAGLARAIRTLYGNGRQLGYNGLKKITQAWMPYRSYACILLWKSLENS